MGRKFQLKNDYYGTGNNLYKSKTVEIQPGITVLVGCNGLGKTTLLSQIKSSLKSDNIPYIHFDNLHDGGSNAISEAGACGNFGFMATAMCSSEGENIVMNIATLASRLGTFVKTGSDPKNKKYEKLIKTISEINGDTVEESVIPKERWILLDAIDSGLSVDNIVDVKELLFKTILEYNFDNEIYIVVSANEYEMARNEQCLDTYTGKYIKFTDYEQYRELILHTRKVKDNRK